PAARSGRPCADHEQVLIRVTELHERDAPDVDDSRGELDPELAQVGHDRVEVVRPPEEPRWTVRGEGGVRVEREARSGLHRDVDDRAVVRGLADVRPEESRV